MPGDRNRTRNKRTRRSHRRIPEALKDDSRFEGLLDRAHYGTGTQGPAILYHYTSWEAAENILQTQRFWATAHDCTNDREELTYADHTLVAMADAFESRATGLGRRALRTFIDGYPQHRISASRTTYLVCLSQKRDDPDQWREYGEHGAGVCIGLRLFGIPEPGISGIATGILPVEYGDARLRERLNAWHTEFTTRVEKAPDIEHNLRVSVAALQATAMAWAVTTKAPRWAAEEEVRMIFLPREGATVAYAERQRSNGTTAKYIEVPVTRLPRMPVEEFIVGPNQDVPAGIQRATRLLVTKKYRRPNSRVFASLCSAGLTG